MAFSNADKSRHGRSAQDSLLSILQRCKSLGYIVDFIEEYRLGKAGFTNRKQFYAPFLITFFDKHIKSQPIMGDGNIIGRQIGQRII